MVDVSLILLIVSLLVLTTVGMKENNISFSTPEKVWTTLLMLIGIGTALYTTAVIVIFLSKAR